MLNKIIFFLLFCSFAYAQTNPIDVSYNGSVTHPDVIYFEDSTGEADGYNYWMVHTPFPPDTVEFPWITRSTDGINWDDTTGLTNPVINNTNEAYGNFSGTQWKFDADPDLLYIKQYDKWFMVWGPRVSGTAGTWSRKEVLAFAYSSDGKTWTQYDGETINGNTNPVILSGNDSNGAAWERYTTLNNSHTQYPTCIFTEDYVFECWYGTTSVGGCSQTNNVSPVGRFTFQWDNVTNDIINFARDSNNPIFTPPATETFCEGVGHLDVTVDNNGKYHLYAVRVKSADSRNSIWHFTSPDGINWDSGEEIIPVGASTYDYTLYRPTVIHDGTGRQVLLNNKPQVIYGGFNNGASQGRLHIKDISNFGVSPTFRKHNRQTIKRFGAKIK